MRVELNQIGTEDPLRIIVDVVGDDFRTDVTAIGEDRDPIQDIFEFLVLGEYVFVREETGEWVRQERPAYVPTMIFSSLLRFETYPLAALQHASGLTIAEETENGYAVVSGQVNHLEALFEHQAREYPAVLGSVEGCDYGLDIDLDGDGQLSYEEVFAELIDYEDAKSVPLSDVKVWIDPEDSVVERVELVPPASLEGGQRVAADGVLRAEYSRFGETTLAAPDTFVTKFSDSGDDLGDGFGPFSRIEEMPPAPDGLEALSKNLMILVDDTGPGTTTIGIPLVERIDNADGVGFYSFVDDEWIKLDIGVRVRDGGCTAEAGLGDVNPENIGVLREK